MRRMGGGIRAKQVKSAKGRHRTKGMSKLKRYFVDCQLSHIYSSSTILSESFKNRGQCLQGHEDKS
jgi:hypothetical protein